MAAKNPTKLPVDALTEKQAKAEHARLHAEISGHDKHYYQDDAPTVTDAEYDALRKRYGAIEDRFPNLRTLESLTLKVGVAPTGLLPFHSSQGRLFQNVAFGDHPLPAATATN